MYWKFAKGFVWPIVAVLFAIAIELWGDDIQKWLGMVMPATLKVLPWLIFVGVFFWM